jgi:ABC-type phosphate transport system substrate-binding protein
MAHKKSFGLGQSKRIRSLRASQALAQRVWTVLLSSVTCATVLGLPSILSSVNVRDIAIAQTATPPVLPSALPQGSSLTIEGSGSLAAVNQALKEKFEGKYQKTPVTFATNGTAAGLQALANGKADLAAIGRLLTPDEKAQGFISIPIKREKIALLVGEENPFRGSLTIEQFAKIFRGEITNWSEVGGPNKPIRVVDQPEGSDTRKAFLDYPVFKAAPFQVVSSAVQVGSEAPDAIAAQLGVDGLGYVTADGIKNLKGVRALDMHKTQPSNPLYPFSQPIAYVYKKGSLSTAAQAFLTYVGTDEGKSAIKSVSSPGAVLGNSAASIAMAIATATPAAVPTPTSTTTLAATPTNVSLAPASVSPALAMSNNSPDTSLDWLPWILGLGLIGGGLVAWWLLKGRGNSPANLPVEPPIDPTPSVPETLDPVVPVTDATTVPPTIASTNSINPVDPSVDPSVAIGAGTAGTLLLDKDSRSCESIGSENPVSDDSIVAVDHDVNTYGAGTVQINPRDSDGNSGGLKFPAIDSAIPPQDVAIAGVAGLAGVAVAGLAGEAKADESAANLTVTSPLVPALILPHEPITQLPPDIHAPLDSAGSVANVTEPPLVPALILPHEPITQLPPDIHAPLDSASPSMNPSTPDPTIAESTTPQLEQPDPDGLPNSAGIVAGVAAGIIAGTSAAGVGNAVLGNTVDNLTADQLANVDHDLPDLVSGYGESRIVLMPRDPQWAYTYWDIPEEHRQSVRYLGGEQLALRLYDATDLDLNTSKPHSVQQYACDELARDWYLPIPVSDRDYITEIGYLTGAGEWLLLARSNRIGIPPVYPTDWMDDQSITIDWEEPLQGKTFLQIVPPGRAKPQTNEAFHDQIFHLAYGMHQEPSLVGPFFGSMHQVPAESLSSFVFPAGAGRWANEFPAGLTASGIGMSSMRMSGIGMSGIGMGASIPSDRSRKFWLVADAELIVYGATEPDAQLTIGGVPVPLTPEGTFRIQLSFQDGNLDFPIMAIAKDGEQMRQVRMTFDRNTPLRKTNSKEDATDERY